MIYPCLVQVNCGSTGGCAACVQPAASTVTIPAAEYAALLAVRDRVAKLEVERDAALARLALAGRVTVAARHVRTFPSDATVLAELFRLLDEWDARGNEKP